MIDYEDEYFTNELRGKLKSKWSVVHKEIYDSL